MAAHPLAPDDPAARPAGRATGRPGWAIDQSLIGRLAARVVAADGAQRVITTTPLTGAPIGELRRSTPQDVARAFATARLAQRDWRVRPIRDRAAILRRVNDVVLAQQSDGLDIVQLETGKSRLHAFDEIADVAINARYYSRRGPGHLGDQRHIGLVPGVTRVREVRHPRGVVGMISPWNYPLVLTVSDAIPALLAGNAVVLKPDSQTPFSALWAADLLAQVGLPDHLFQVVYGSGPVVGTAIIQQADYLCFTGSTATGTKVATQAAERLVGVSLELGGKNPVYVAQDADLDRAAEAIVRDCFANSGHACVSMERLIVHERIAGPFLDRFIGRVERLKLGAGLDYASDIGSIASKGQFHLLQRHVQDALDQGATLLTGGKPRPDIGPLFFEPTVLDNVPESALCYGQETFGPLVSVFRVPSDADGIRVANSTEYGLNASVWAGDRRRGDRIARHIDAGTVTINEAYSVVWGSVQTPMGGRKQSGIGRRHGRDGLLRFTESQSVAHQRLPLGWLYSRGGKYYSTVFTRVLRFTRAIRLPWP